MLKAASLLLGCSTKRSKVRVCDPSGSCVKGYSWPGAKQSKGCPGFARSWVKTLVRTLSPCHHWVLQGQLPEEPKAGKD